MYNRWFNKEVARLQSIRDKQGIKENTRRINRLFRDRDNYVHDYLNKAIKAVVDYCRENKVEKVFCGDGKGWKRGINLGGSNNEKFVQISFDKFKQKLKHKLEFYGIEFELVDESYTSKCSFFDSESIEHHEEYVGSRVERGLFKTSDGVLINADVNGALNIAKKGLKEIDMGKPETLGVGCSGGVDTPRRMRKPLWVRMRLRYK
ncbi:MAG: IS605 OrfB-like transposable element containing RNAse H-like and Zn finger domain [Candidatus Methanohalarchaeum thermophilum]|uniref:IS605 OrfB-like transposable element containing RNAse H-like and Zn finger domain n=1 Tax=Methanohalarchaeum thermophilum TaxID=1903181 RepID=A0A1Q6DX83_METT1|nr:MAG: IS605 OrfB-like transposable element containing RNAse H-like and Zn finger domain [Candidatus Methanohalarchaeum thermophilum]